MNSTDQNKLPKPILWLILVIFCSILLLCAGEVFARIVPGPWSSSFFYRYDPVFGTWHLENFSGDNVSVDYTIRDISLNSFGMRDRERVIQKEASTTRIAFLGDSIVEGVQVADDEVLTRRMEALFNDGTEVLNFAVSGFGTLQEYIEYKELVRQFKPDIVVLGFYTGNDMRNNSRELETLYNGSAPERPFLIKQEDGKWGFVPVPPKEGSQNSVILFLKRHFALYRLVWYEKNRIPSLLGRALDAQDKTSEKEGTDNLNANLANLFVPTAGPEFAGAWEVTEHVIREFRDAVRADGAQFVLVLIHDPVAMEADPKAALERAYGTTLPDGYDAEYPQRRLLAFARKEHIPALDLTPIFKAYRDEHHLVSPYFSFAHDGHWSALGHSLAAEAVAKYLRTIISKLP